MGKTPTNAELILVINSLLEKHRDALSNDDVQSLEKAIDVLKKFEDSGSKEPGKMLESLAQLMLKVFSSPEILKQIIELFNN